MKYYELTNGEKQILEDYKKGLFESDENLEKTKKRLKLIARNTFSKSKTISIRVNLKTLLGLRAKAIEEGIPYQTLAGSILHKSVSGYA